MSAPVLSIKSKPGELIELFRWSSEPVCVIDRAEVVRAMNPKARELFGTLSSFEEVRFSHLFQKGMMFAARDAWELLAGQSKEASFDAPPASKDGSYTWYSWRLITISDRYLWLMGCVQQEQDKIVQTLKEEVARLRGFIDHAGDLFFAHDMAGQIVDVNRAAYECLGYTREELLALPVSELDPSIKQSQLGGIWKRMTPGEAITVESHHRRKDGSLCPMELRLMLFGPDHDLRMMAVARDITQRREADEAKKLLTQELRETRDAALKANKFKSIFLANMSHELRTPLNAIIGYTELVDEELEDCGLQELREDTQKIGQAGRHLLALVNDILDLSKIESDKIELEEETFYFLDLFDELNTVLYPLLQKNNNTLHIVNASSLQKITTDRMRLHQVLLNLLSNANKFTTEGEITLSLSQETTGGMDCYHLSVQDTGVGIASERLPYLFEPFSQADGSIWKRFGGTGLGLAISRKLCRLMGGDLFVKSEVEVGSTFTIVLPVYINETKSLIQTGDIPSPYEPQKRSCPPPSDG